MEVVMKFIDLVGAYEMPPRALEKAEKARAEARKLEQKEMRNKAEEILAKKRQRRKV
jgi:hypothetical protein